VPNRSLPLPDFRCVYLSPRPTGVGWLSSRQCLLVGSLSLLVALGVLLSEGMWAASLVAVLASGLAFRAAATRWQASDVDHVQAAMVIVPWGVLVDPERDLRVLHWAAVRDVTVQEKHVMRGGTPYVISTRVTVRTERDRLRGDIGGPAGLEHLLANLHRYAEEAARPIAGDLDGDVSIEDSDAEPVVEQLISRARALCSTGEGATRLQLPACGYRRSGSAMAGPETTAALRTLLSAGPPSSASELSDPRPLAAMIAAHLGATALVPDLLRLMSSPNPVVAAVSKACALRLGATPNRAGTLDEVAQFIREEDLAALRDLACESGAVARAA